MIRKGVFMILVCCPLILGLRWGFFGHQRINEMAVFTLPQPLAGFYKAHLRYLADNAVNPDMRRYAVEGEAPRHFIDLDVYPDSVLSLLRTNWFDVVKVIPEDTLQAYGIVPWHITSMYYQLKNAFMEKDPAKILRLSAEIGHYIADANVPLHTTENYNGQLTNQRGIHGLWESRLPELFFEDYSFFVGRAEYFEDPLVMAWSAVMQAHAALDSVLQIEKALSSKFSPDKKYTFEERGSTFIKTYSREFCKEYHKKLSGMVQRRMRASVKMIGDFWFTCWVHAGQPDLSKFHDFDFSDYEKEQERKQRESWRRKIFKVREETGEDSEDKLF